MKIRWSFSVADLATVERLFQKIPPDWPDAIGFFSTPESQAAVNYKLIFDQGLAMYEPLDYAERRRPKPPTPLNLLNLLSGKVMPKQIELKRPTWRDEWGVPREISQSIALGCFTDNYLGEIAFFSPRIGREGARPEKMSVWKHKDQNEFNVVISCDIYWGGQEESVTALVEAARSLGLNPQRSSTE